MDNTLLQQLAELPGLKAALDTIQGRINAIEAAARGPVSVPAPAPVNGHAEKPPTSQAKLDALAKARAAKAAYARKGRKR